MEMITRGPTWMYTKSKLRPRERDFNHLENKYKLLAFGLERPHIGPYKFRKKSWRDVIVLWGDLLVMDITYL